MSQSIASSPDTPQTDEERALKERLAEVDQILTRIEATAARIEARR